MCVQYSVNQRANSVARLTTLPISVEMAIFAICFIWCFSKLGSRSRVAFWFFGISRLLIGVTFRVFEAGIPVLIRFFFPRKMQWRPILVTPVICWPSLLIHFEWPGNVAFKWIQVIGWNLSSVQPNGLIVEKPVYHANSNVYSHYSVINDFLYRMQFHVC